MAAAAFLAGGGGEVLADLWTLVDALLAARGTDLILTAGAPPTVRVDRTLRPLGAERLGPADTERMARQALGPRWSKFEAEREADFSLERGPARLRANAFWQRGAVGLALRVIPREIPAPESLGVPEPVRRFAELPRGLVLVTGPTGSGKSTTLAALIDRINATQSKHIVTIEDPIEYVHDHRRSLVEQREVGADTASFAAALREALRQNPDVILVGEMRDLETISLAITAAETGHLVFATLHTQDVAQTVDRIVDVFPAVQQQQVRTQLAAVLQGIVNQQLLPRLGGGLVAAFEVLVVDHAIRAHIREGTLHQIRSAMEASRARTGSQTLEAALADLVRRGLVDQDVALGATTRPAELLAALRAEGRVERAPAPLGARRP